ncbi:MAG: hypothetical protein WC780_08200 [Lentimicrobiaceae bacterium]
MSEIANGITIIQNQMQGYKVICRLNARSLKYQNKTITVKEGMNEDVGVYTFSLGGAAGLGCRPCGIAGGFLVGIMALGCMPAYN